MKSTHVPAMLIVVFCFASGCDLGTYSKRFKERERDARLQQDSQVGTDFELVGERDLVVGQRRS